MKSFIRQMSFLVCNICAFAIFIMGKVTTKFA